MPRSDYRRRTACCHGLADDAPGSGRDDFDIAATEAEAVTLARLHPPHLITSDVKLIEGSGPQAVRQILEEMKISDLPVILITGTPDACQPCEPPALIVTKPLADGDLARAFKALDPIGRIGRGSHPRQ